MDLIAAAACAMLSGMGVGGGGLLIIYLTTFAGVDQRAAQGINLCFFLLASFAAVGVHLKKRKINYSLVLTVSLVGAVFAVLGSFAGGLLGDEWLRRGFGFFMVGAGIITLAKTFLAKRKK